MHAVAPVFPFRRDPAAGTVCLTRTDDLADAKPMQRLFSVLSVSLVKFKQAQ